MQGGRDGEKESAVARAALIGPDWTGGALIRLEHSDDVCFQP